MSTISWEEFIKNCEEIVQLSQAFGDNWQLVSKGTADGQTYLSGSRKIETAHPPQMGEEAELECSELSPVTSSYTGDIITVEYHVVYSISYQVPILFFAGFRSDGCLINLEDSWKMFSSAIKEYSPKEMLSILTQTDHPVLFRPFLNLHPCKTAEVLGQTKDSRNKVLTFLSVYGPFVKLTLNEMFGAHFSQCEELSVQ